MIDVETEVLNAVYPYIEDLVPEDSFSSVYVPAPSSFPFVTLMEMDNISDTGHQSTALDEEYAVITYEANVYATDKLDCREIMDALDQAMIRLNFTRLSMTTVPNLADRTIFRITARYRAVADQSKRLYRHR